MRQGYIIRNNNNKNHSLLFVMIGLFVALPLQNILLYQLSYWHISESIRIIIFIIIEAPLLIYLLYRIINKTIGKKLTSATITIFTITSILFLWMLTIVFINWENELFLNYNKKNLQWIAMHGFYFIIGFSLADLGDSMEKYKKPLVFGLVLMWIQTIIFFDYSAFLINLEEPSSNSPIHLFLGTSFALWALLTISVFQKRSQVILYIICSLGIFFQGSRAAFYCFVFILPLIILQYPMKTRIIVSIVTIVFISIFVLLYLKINFFANHRMFSILDGSDTSLNYRLQILRQNIPDIFEFWLWGDYGGFFRYEFPANIWIHNILAYWRQFGLVSFTLLLSLFVISFSKFKSLLIDLANPVSFITAGAIIIFTIAVVFAKSHNYSPLYLLFGLSAAYLSKHKASFSNLK